MTQKIHLLSKKINLLTSRDWLECNLVFGKLEKRCKEGLNHEKMF